MVSIDKEQFGPWAVVTGASSGIGREFARQLAASGVNLILVSRRLPLLKALGAELAQVHGIAYRAVGLDLTKEDFIKQLDEATHDLEVGLVISDAGSGGPEAFLHTEHAWVREIVQLNAIAHLELTYHFGRKMAQRGHGGILLVSTMGARQAVPYIANLAAAKAYVLSLGEALHVELQKTGIHVTVLLPGPTDTQVASDFGFDGRRLPLRMMSPEECAAEGLAALKANRATRIAGRMNRIMAAVMPRALVSSMFGKMMHQAVMARSERSIARSIKDNKGDQAQEGTS